MKHFRLAERIPVCMQTLVYGVYVCIGLLDKADVERPRIGHCVRVIEVAERHNASALIHEHHDAAVLTFTDASQPEVCLQEGATRLHIWNRKIYVIELHDAALLVPLAALVTEVVIGQFDFVGMSHP